MLKEERLGIILSEVNSKGIIKVSDLNETLNVSEMTIRRDITELEMRGDVIKIHGGAKKADLSKQSELSHIKKQEINQDAKHEIAKKIASVIENGDVVFLGAGTTIENIADYIDVERVKIITNSLPLFYRIMHDERIETMLVGGVYRPYTGSFVGSIANSVLEKLQVNKAFIGVNGICGSKITNYNEEEGITQRTILNNADEKYIIADLSKIGYTDFFHFYNLDDADYLITNDAIDASTYDEYSKKVKIL